MSFCFKYNSPIVSSIKSNNYNLKKYMGKNVKSVDFINQHSVKSNKLYFTNMFQRNNSPRINSIIMAISDLISNPDNLDYYSDGYERGFQLFHTRDSDGNAKIYLIDLYHLAIPSKKNNLIKEYSMVMEYKKDIHDVVFSKVNSLV